MMKFNTRFVILGIATLLVFLFFKQHQKGIFGRTRILAAKNITMPMCTSAAGRDAEADSLMLMPGGHRLGIVIPFRNRMKELSQLVPRLTKFLNKQEVDHKFFVVHQDDDLRFNRGMLLNIGSLVAMDNDCDYIALHDVDLVPLDDQLNYRYPSNGPYHVSAPGLHPKYKFKKFLGGIILLRVEDLILINGFSNRFWGWGKEDDDFRRRVLDHAHLVVNRPPPLAGGMKNTFKHMHGDGDNDDRDKVRHSGQESIFNITDPSEGLNTTALSTGCLEHIVVSGIKVNFVKVELACNMTDTPWCKYAPKG